MNEWMDGWMMNGWMDGQTDGWMDEEEKEGCGIMVDERVGGEKYERECVMDGWVNGEMDEANIVLEQFLVYIERKGKFTILSLAY